MSTICWIKFGRGPFANQYECSSLICVRLKRRKPPFTAFCCLKSEAANLSCHVSTPVPFGNNSPTSRKLACLNPDGTRHLCLARLSFSNKNIVLGAGVRRWKFL